MLSYYSTVASGQRASIMEDGEKTSGCLRDQLLYGFSSASICIFVLVVFVEQQIKSESGEEELNTGGQGGTAG